MRLFASEGPPDRMLNLYRGGLNDPADVVQHALTMFRRGDTGVLRPYLPESYWPAAGEEEEGGNAPGAPGAGLPELLLRVGGRTVAERGPLASLAGLLDTGARRVLPGNLLRRSAVLSTLRAGDAFQQRTAVTACSGEEAVLEWRLRRRDPDEGGGSAASAGGSSSAAAPGGDSSASGSGSTSGGGGSVCSRNAGWVIESVARDPACDEPLPTTPHPRRAQRRRAAGAQCSPEAVVLAQLQALQQFDTFEAGQYNMWRCGTTGTGRLAVLVQSEMLQHQLAAPPYRLLLGHAAAQLGPAALPSQREQLQEVFVFGGEGSGAAVYTWRLGMQANGCWMVLGIAEASGALGM
eukprot:scaffold9.g3174.t1